MISWGHFTTAVYRAHHAYPDNGQVVATVRGGLKGVTLFSARTPRDVLAWIRDLHNKYHRGSGITFIEVMRKSLEVEATWKIYKHENSITARSGTGEDSYERAYWKWVSSEYSHEKSQITFPSL